MVCLWCRVIQVIPRKVAWIARGWAGWTFATLSVAMLRSTIDIRSSEADKIIDDIWRLMDRSSRLIISLGITSDFALTIEDRL